LLTQQWHGDAFFTRQRPSTSKVLMFVVSIRRGLTSETCYEYEPLYQYSKTERDAAYAARNNETFASLPEMLRTEALEKKFRVIVLHSGSFGCGEDFTIGMGRISIHKSWAIDEIGSLCPSYEAVSYAWENFGKPRSVQCTNGTTLLRRQTDPRTPTMAFVPCNARMMVSEPVFDMLESLQPRRGFDYRLIWVDAICICQDDIVEGAEQVEMMGDIYRNARRVVVFIPERDSTPESCNRVLVRQAIQKLSPLDAALNSSLANNVRSKKAHDFSSTGQTRSETAST
jgi:hypothetical protein